MYTIKDQNGLYVDERAIGIMPDETGKEEWAYTGYSNIFNGVYIYPTKQKAEKIMEYLYKVNAMAGFDLQLHIEALKKDYTIPSKIQLTTKPIARGTKTKTKRIIKQLKKELTS